MGSLPKVPIFVTAQPGHDQRTAVPAQNHCASQDKQGMLLLDPLWHSLMMRRGGWCVGSSAFRTGVVQRRLPGSGPVKIRLCLLQWLLSWQGSMDVHFVWSGSEKEGPFAMEGS